MKLYRVTDLNGNFLRDDFTFDELTEKGIEVDVPQGFISPKWDGTQWIEGATPTKLAEVETQRLVFTLSEENRTSINAFLKTAIDENKVYTALTAPTTTQNTKQIKALTKQTNKMIRLMLNLLDSAE